MELLRPLRYARRYRNWRDVVRAREAGGYPRSVVLRNGMRFAAPEHVNPARLANGVVFKRQYTPPGFEIGPDDNVVDVGANIGVFSVLAARSTRGRVLAVEPFPENVAYLRRNLEANGCADRVDVVPCALAEREGRARLRLAERGVEHRLTAPDEAERAGRFLEVETRTLEALARERGLQRIDLLKLDCEGAEGRILASMPEALLASVRRVAMEFHDDASALRHDQLQALLEAGGLRTELRWDGRSKNGFLYGCR